MTGPVALDTHPEPPQPLRRICAWCPDFDKTDPANAHATHFMCETCHAAWEQEAQADNDEEEDRGEELSGSMCGAWCGDCGRCS